MNSIRKTILEALQQETYLHMSQLATLTGATDRTVRKAIQCLRIEGMPIISNTSGYKLASNKEEIENFIRFMKSQAFGKFRSIAELEKGLKYNEQQIDIKDYYKEIQENE